MIYVVFVFVLNAPDMNGTKRVCRRGHWRVAVLSKFPQSDGGGRVGISRHYGFAESRCSVSSAAMHFCRVSGVCLHVPVIVDSKVFSGYW